ncbi:hypothetical protein DMJ13_27580 [halophilic archaeon]|nr:hypothetical protein DMJ13_27580 [halophilic archaeon]
MVARVADHTNIAPEQLPPLYEVINPDALATLFEPTVAGEQRSTGHVSFTYSDCHVTVTSQGDIDVETLS